MTKYKIKNDKESKKNRKKIKEPKIVNDNESEIKTFFIILIVVVVIVIGLYFLSKLIVDKRSASNKTENTTTGKIDYSVVSVGTILNRPYDDYYVLVYDSDDTNAIYYSNLYGKYESKEDHLKIYFCDLSNLLNKPYVAEDGESNPYATSVEDFSFGKVTLLRVRYGQIINYLEDAKSIAEELS